MTDSPPPSDRPKSAKGATFGLFRPVLFAIGVIGLAMGGLVLSHRSNPQIASLPSKTAADPTVSTPPAPSQAAAPPVILADSQPAPPVTAADFGKPPALDLRGFQMKPPEASASDAEPQASDSNLKLAAAARHAYAETIGQLSSRDGRTSIAASANCSLNATRSKTPP